MQAGLSEEAPGFGHGPRELEEETEDDLEESEEGEGEEEEEAEHEGHEGANVALFLIV